jgi:hypothetical protein
MTNTTRNARRARLKQQHVERIVELERENGLLRGQVETLARTLREIRARQGVAFHSTHG